MMYLIRLKESRAVRPVVSARRLGRVYLTGVLAAAVLVLTAAVLTTGAVAASHTGAVVKLGRSNLGRIIVDSHGRTLYLFARDKRGKSTCYGTCASYWPPLITRGKPRASSGARSELVGTTPRKDGKLQVTYHGHPLYRFFGDGGAGQITGEGLNDFGGRWYAVSAAGSAVRKATNSQRVHARLSHGRLTVEGTDASDRIALRVKAGHPDILQVDAGDDGSADFSFKRRHVARIALDARAGDDSVRIDESNGMFTDSIPTTLQGGAGNDTLSGGSGAETLLGGDDNDTIDGNKGNDQSLLGAGDDTFVWDPGDGSDTVEGQAGNDRMVFNGAAAAEKFDLSANGSRLKLVRDIGNVTMDTAGVERVDVNGLGGVDVATVNDLTGTDVTSVNLDLAATLGGTAGDGAVDRVVVNGTNGNDAIDVNGDSSEVKVSGLVPTVAILHPEATDLLAVDGGAGNDVINASALSAGAIALVLDGGAGNDVLAGGPGVETLTGGDGNDSIDGNGGNDLALLGAGNDTFVWDPGDGSDTVEGQDGTDTMRFNGANVAERVGLSANGNRLTFVRAPGNVTMDTAGVERVDFNALGGADLVAVGDLSGTDVTSVNVDLAGTLGGGSGDGQADSVTVDGTNANDTINLSGDPAGVAVSGLAAVVAIQHQEPTDALTVNGLDGKDSISAAGLAAQAIALTLDGGAGDDTIAGGQGIETLLGGEGNDSIDGNGGNDTASLGAGDDTFVWDPGDGSDTVEGQDGTDTMLFNGANASEQVDLSANGNRLKFFRTQGNVTMDTAGVELVDFNALGGADLVTVNDLSGTDVGSVNVDLAGTLGGAIGDGQPDRVVLNATNGDDTIRVFGDATEVTAKGLAPLVGILHPEVANDRLEINTLAGNDTVDSSGLAAGAIQLFVDGVLVP
jgi:predicted lipoprotein with Yx(FWY)xxD motif